MPPFHLAASFAARAHAGQFRRDGITPYFCHVARVAMAVSAIFGCSDDASIAAAFLHDTIEDTPTDYDDLAKHFGKPIAGCVAALTKNMALPQSARERDYDRRLAAADWRARLIKLADTYDNFLDAATATKRKKARDKCRRAIALARADAKSHPETARAIAIVKKVAKLTA
jgi:(p)ppGpp synthase/HD superfamily hydrolase